MKYFAQAQTCSNDCSSKLWTADQGAEAMVLCPLALWQREGYFYKC